MWTAPIYFVVLATLAVWFSWKKFKKDVAEFNGMSWVTDNAKSGFWMNATFGVMLSAFGSLLCGLVTALWFGTVPMALILGFLGYKAYKRLNAKLDQVIANRD